MRQMLIWGNLIDADDAARKGKDEEDAGLVPRSWELVAERDGKPRVLAHGVVSFDLTPDGGVVYSTGRAIYRLAPSGAKDKLHEDAGVVVVSVVA